MEVEEKQLFPGGVLACCHCVQTVIFKIKAQCCINLDMLVGFFPPMITRMAETEETTGGRDEEVEIFTHSEVKIIFKCLSLRHLLLLLQLFLRTDCFFRSWLELEQLKSSNSSLQVFTYSSH